MRDDFSFEEMDDARTFNGELVPDCEAIPVVDEVISPVIEYVAQFKALIDDCGWVSYHFNMRKYLAAKVNKAKIVASAYQHDLAYYIDQLNEWRTKAEIAFGALSVQAARLGYTMPERKLFLNMLTLYSDRRKAYKGYLQTCLKKKEARSPERLEADYQKLLEKRLKKKH
ncbi:hypothetical protein IJI28_03220 [Candidatus Saccharibacteria bacterium]|nr:hypothetical protein [Candidatus Saccharibacteria bacterium]